MNLIHEAGDMLHHFNRNHLIEVVTAYAAVHAVRQIIADHSRLSERDSRHEFNTSKHSVLQQHAQ
jgi:hypothetical protein